uniref:1,4-dihydroxy-2-naphthoyl-CoA synthase n=1 Tax=Leptocylindrus danicus TaxID=163516 RepID=A0A7S2PKJ0_9STRA
MSNQHQNSNAHDVASMSAARSSDPNASPTHKRDGIHLISTSPAVWENLTGKYQFSDVTYKVSVKDKVARIAFNRPEVLNAFRPRTINEIRKAIELAQDDINVGVIILTSENQGSFCAGGDQNVRGEGGYDDGTEDAPRLRVLDLQVQMRRCPKPIMAVVYGYAIGGGHILHMLCDITLASDDAVFGQTGPRMGSFDAGYGSTHMARLVGQKKAREMWFLCKFYSAEEAVRIGLVNAVYKKAELEGEAMRWCRRMIMNSPTAIACCKAALNADEDGAAGVALLAGQATRLFYLTEESKEGKKAFLEKRAPRFRDLPSSRL